MLRLNIEQNPAFADTISYKQGMEKLAPRESILSRIKKALGRYDEGGYVGDFSEMQNKFQNITKDYKDADKIVKAGDLFPFRDIFTKKDGKFSQVEGSRLNPEQKRDDETIKEFYMRTNPKELMQDLTEEIELAIAGQTNIEKEEKSTTKDGKVSSNVKDIFENLILSQPKHSDYGQASYTYADESTGKSEIYEIFERLLFGAPIADEVLVQGKRR